VHGQDLPYFVVSIDDERQEVNLIPVFGSAPGLDGVPFSDLHRGRVKHPESSEC
jgi:hypothetical protein